MKEVVVILDNVRSAHNVGSIFRTADGAGVEHLYLVGITPAPTDRFGRIRLEIEKTSLGATHTVAWSRVGTGEDLATAAAVTLVRSLQSEGYTVVAVEQSPKAVALPDFVLPPKVAYLFGAEVEGVQQALLDAADQILEIPMQGEKESLNVSVTAGIILFMRGGC